ncbi:hypothetical protein [Candidatus Binatus soli]|jgi:hypothetical protein|uniref:hypothetical protein n=1 Tax=Candidatus Binatus soli TaxID=1953413 RepID=UPI003D0C514D
MAAILNLEVLRNFLKSSGRAIATTLRAAACILSVAMLLSFPTARAHHFGQHVGATEIRQNIVRHTFVAGPETGGVEKIAHIDAQPAIPMPVIIENVAKGFFPLAIASEVPTFRLLQHFKLGPSRSGAPDPLL